MLRVNHRIAIPLREFRWDYTLASGPGGQNVNKVHSRAVLRWNPSKSEALPGPVRERLLQALQGRLTNEGELIVASQRTRDQGRNVDDCLEKLRKIVLAAATPPRPRKATKPTRASKVRRLEAKHLRSAAKRLRRPPDTD